MFCPPGYISWQDMCDLTYDWSERIYLSKSLEDEGKDPSLAFDESRHPSDMRFYTGRFDASHNHAEWSQEIREKHFSASLIDACLLSKVLLAFDTFLCSSEGHVMKAPEAILLHADRLDWCYCHGRSETRQNSVGFSNCLTGAISVPPIVWKVLLHRFQIGACDRKKRYYPSILSRVTHRY